MTGRARWEDPEVEVVEEVLHVATTLHDMDGGESVRNSFWRGLGVRQRVCARSALGDRHQPLTCDIGDCRSSHNGK